MVDAWQNTEAIQQLSAEEKGLLRVKTSASLKALEPDALATLATGLVRSDVGCLPPWSSLWHELASAAKPVVHKCKPNSVQTIAWAFATAGCRAPGLFDEMSRVQAARADELSPTHLAGTAWAHAIVQDPPSPPLFSALATSARPRLAAFQPAGVATMMWAYAASDVACPALFGSDDFAAYIEAVTRSKRWQWESLCQIHQYALWCDERQFSAYVPLPRELREASHAAFVAAPASPSHFQRQVGRALKLAGVQHMEHEVTLPSGYSVDLVVEYEGVRIAVEVDGPSHFLGDSEHYNGSTMLKHRQLRSSGWPVLSVPYFAFVAGETDFEGVYRALNLRAGLDALVDPLHRSYELLRLDPPLVCPPHLTALGGTWQV